ncbi:MAG: copper oxidase [Gemmatimonadales bacterium]|nr:copper oxidase [Gemmatimonadales bacterium]
MDSEATRRTFLQGGTMAAAGLIAGAAPAVAQDAPAGGGHEGHAQAGGGPRERPAVGSASDRGKLVPGFRAAGLAPVPVEVPDGPPKLAWKMVNGAKEFHLFAGHLKREVLPDVWIDVWGYNGSMPGPMIEVVEGDKVRIVVHNKLPEPTIMHWHGIDVPNAMDGVEGLIQDPIKPGGTFTYEFTLEQNGTFFYHTHVAMQQGMGMVGLFIVHPKVAHFPPVDRDIALIIQEWAILPGSTIPNTMSMEFNLFTLNGRAAPYITPMVVKQGERVRIRLVNFSAIDHHPMHLHGITFWITGTEGGRIPDTAWIPSNNVLVAVAQARDVEFVAKNPGDWVFHCHMFHHMMNFMSTMVGPMGGHSVQGMRAGQSSTGGMGIATGGSALSSEAFGPSFGRSMGEQTSLDRAVGNMSGMPGMGSGSQGGMPGMPGMESQSVGMRMEEARKVPGYPQGMADMAAEMSEGKLQKLTGKREARGLRRDWYTGVEGLMTVVRVLPPDLFDAVTSGKGDVAPGASVPGAGAGPIPAHGGHQGHPR